MLWSLKTRAALPTNKPCSEERADDNGWGEGGSGMGFRVSRTAYKQKVCYKTVYWVTKDGEAWVRVILCDIVTLLRFWIALPVTPHSPSSTSSLLSVYCRSPFCHRAHLQVNPPITTLLLAQAHCDFVIKQAFPSSINELFDACSHLSEKWLEIIFKNVLLI